ncbi:hypothetical protein D9758_013048 [Tetrapyrgos nigripes]|uniref:Uncharacterized protein n=1 Tax=Tetrapyrgos nigripes TaxID=182062 RepID=A0A8H5FQS7_9AGAR|nr:hypothetical protein D9758_013048 [Tetrapyrgos nigripes]
MSITQSVQSTVTPDRTSVEKPTKVSEKDMDDEGVAHRSTSPFQFPNRTYVTQSDPFKTISRSTSNLSSYLASWNGKKKVPSRKQLSDIGEAFFVPVPVPQAPQSDNSDTSEPSTLFSGPSSSSSSSPSSSPSVCASASTASLVPTEVCVDSDSDIQDHTVLTVKVVNWDDPEEANEELKRLGIKVRDYAYEPIDSPIIRRVGGTSDVEAEAEAAGEVAEEETKGLAGDVKELTSVTGEEIDREKSCGENTKS